MGAPRDADLIRVEKRGGLPALAAGEAGVAVDGIRFRVSTEDVDAYGDVVVQAGLEFPETLPAVADHSMRLEAALGDWHNVERGVRETFATLRLLPAGVSRMADLVRALHAGGFPLASSVNFDITRGDIEPIFKTEGARQVQTGLRYRRGKVREITLTQFPANPQAVAVARSLGFNDAELAALSRTEPSAPTPPRRTTQAVAGAHPHGATIVTLSEMIAAAQAAHESAQTALDTATTNLDHDASDANLQAVARATTEADNLFARLNTLRAAETAASRRAAAAPAPTGAPPTPVARAVAHVTGPEAAAPGLLTRRTNTRDVPVGWRLAQIAIACSVARERRRGVDQVAQEMFASEPEVVAIARSLVGSADTTTAGWAAELVRTETRAMLDETLVPLSLWAQLAQLGMSLNFNGAHSVLVPQLNIGMGTGGSAWVGEAGVIPVVKGNLTAKRLFQYKLGNIIPMTKELQRTSDPSAVEQMRKILAQFLSNLLDSSMIDALPEVAGVRPAGLLFGVTPITGAAGGGYAALQKDLQAVTDAFTAAGVGGRPVLAVNVNKLFTLRTMTNALGQFVFPDGANSVLGYPVIGSAFVPASSLIAVDANKFASAIDPLEYDLSEQATLTMANADATAPTQAGAAPLGGALGTAGQVIPDGGIPVAGGSGASIAGTVAISLWQTWALAIRCVVPASFGLTQAGAVQQVTGITW